MIEFIEKLNNILEDSTTTGDVSMGANFGISKIKDEEDEDDKKNDEKNDEKDDKEGTLILGHTEHEGSFEEKLSRALNDPSL